MTTKGLTLVLTLALIFSIVPPQAQAAYSSSVPSIEIIQTVSFRESASTSSDRIRYLKPGETLDMINKPNNYWYEARDSSGTIGFVSSSSTYINISTNLIYPDPNGEAISTVSFRTGPSTSSDRIRYLSKGEFVWIIEKVNSYWFKAADKNSIVGYVSTNAKYIHTDFSNVTELEPVPETEPEEATYVDEPNAQVVKSVSFRTGPSTSNERIRYLQAGEPLWILKKINSYWYEARDKNGTLGYVSTNSSYISSSFIEEPIIVDPVAAVERVINAGMTYLGTPYEFGSSRLDTSTFDCSDFVRQIFLDGIGLMLPGDSRQQAEKVKELAGGQANPDWTQLQRGDLMFFMSYKGYTSADYENIDKSIERVTHVGVYLGNGQILHTYSIASGGVLISNMAGSSWDYRFLYGGQAMKTQ